MAQSFKRYKKMKIECAELAVAGVDVTSAIAEVAAINGLTASAAELNILDGATLATAELNILDGVTKTAAQINLLVAGVAGGYKVARVEMALDGSNPTSWATGLTTIIAGGATLKGSAAPGVGTSILTAVINGTSLDVYAWKVTSSIDNTLIASTGTETFYGWAIGT